MQYTHYIFNILMKLKALLLSSILGLTLIAACGKKADEAKPMDSTVTTPPETQPAPAPAPSMDSTNMDSTHADSTHGM